MGYTYYSGPTVRFVSPDAGPTAGHTLVRLFGEGLDAGHAAGLAIDVTPGLIRR